MSRFPRPARREARRRHGVVALGTVVALTSVVLVGTAAPSVVAGGATYGTTRVATVLTVPTAEGHRSRHGAVPRRTTDVRGVDALGAGAPGGAARAAASNRVLVTYGGGLTVTGSSRGDLTAAGVTTGQPKVYLVFMGAQWGTASTTSSGTRSFSNDPDGLAPVLQALYSGLGTDGETWSGTLTQYCDGAAVGATTCTQGDVMIPYPAPGVLAGVWHDSSAAATSEEQAGLTEHQIALEAEVAATHFGNTDQSSNRDAQYVIASPTGTDPDGWSDPTTGYCGYHDDTHDPAITGGGAVSGPVVAFTNLPYVPDAGASCGAGTVTVPGTLDGATETAGHEYAETLSDQFPEGLPTPGWIDAGGNEIADLCEYLTTGPGAMFDLSLATGNFAMQGLWSNSADGGRGSCEDGSAAYVFVPSISSVSPESAAAGAPVTIAGTNLGGATSVSFAGTPATIESDTPGALVVLVPAVAADGTITVVSPLGTVSSPRAFHLDPTVTSCTPATVVRGGTLTISGSGLDALRKVVLGGRRVVVRSDTATQIVVAVGTKAVSGALVVTTRYGTATCAGPVAVTSG